MAGLVPAIHALWPGGRCTKSLPALLAEALNETVVMTIDGRRRKLTKCRGDRNPDGRQIGECRSARDQAADRHDERRRAKGGRRCTAARPRRLAAAEKEVVHQFVARLRRQILQEIEDVKAAEPSDSPPWRASNTS